MLRPLIKDITVELSQPRQLVAHIRWQGGACTDVCVRLPPHRADSVRYPAAVVDRVRHWLRACSTHKSSINSIRRGWLAL